MFSDFASTNVIYAATRQKGASHVKKVKDTESLYSCFHFLGNHELQLLGQQPEAFLLYFQ